MAASLKWQQSWGEFSGPPAAVAFVQSWIDVTIPVEPFNILQIAPINIAGAGQVSAVGGGLGYGIPFEIEWGVQTDVAGSLAVAGDLGAVIGAVPHAITQVGAFTVIGSVKVFGDLGYTIGPGIPFNLAQTTPIGLVGVLQTLGNIGVRQPFTLLTQPIGVVGTLQLLGNINAPDVFLFEQVGEIALTGTLLGYAEFEYFDRPTGGLPFGWRVERFLETVPNPNYGTAYGNHFFTRWTYRGFDDNNQQVAASGSEDDCITQTLSIAQTRRCC